MDEAIFKKKNGVQNKERGAKLHKGNTFAFNTFTTYSPKIKKMKTTGITIPSHSVNATYPFLFVYDTVNDQYVNFTVEPSHQESDHHRVHEDEVVKLHTTRAVRTYQVRTFKSADTSGDYEVVNNTEMSYKRRRDDVTIEDEDPFSMLSLGIDTADSFENAFMSALSQDQHEKEVKDLKQENKWLTCMIQTLQAEMREKNDIQQHLLKTCARLTKDMEEIKTHCFKKKGK